MSRVNTGPRAAAARPAAGSDIYTVLLIAGALALLLAIIYVAYRAQTLFGGILPPGGA